MTYQLGIDFGTTFTSAAVSRDGRVEAINLGTRSMVVPSVVLVRTDGEILIGDAAETRAVVEPNRVAREFKRRLGDPTPLFLGGTPYSAEALIGYVLGSIYQRVVERMGSAPTAVVITHPAAYSQYRLDLLRDAARRAGIAEAKFVPEPEAAAIYYASQARVAPGEVIAMFDLGGGTFDTALLRRLETRFELIGTPQGLERLGGVDFDDAIVGFVNDQLGGALSEANESDPQTMMRLGRLRSDSRAAKEALSEDTEAIVQVVLPSGAVDVRISRQQFESLIRPRLSEALQALDRAITSAGLTMEQVSKIVLVGGSSRIPIVREMVAKATDRPLAIDIDPEHAVSMGAAFAASGRSLSAVDSTSQQAIVPPSASTVNLAGPLPAMTQTAGGTVVPASPGPFPGPPSGQNFVPSAGAGAPAQPGAAPYPPGPMATGPVPTQPTPYVPQTPTQPVQRQPPYPPQPYAPSPYGGQPPAGAPPYVQPPGGGANEPSRSRLYLVLAAVAIVLIALLVFALTRNNDNTASTTTTEQPPNTDASTIVTEPDTSGDTTAATTETTTETTTDATAVPSETTVAETTAVTAAATEAPTEPPTQAPTEAPTSPPDPNVVAQQQLDAQVAADQSFVDGNLVGHFIVQLSAKAVDQVDPTQNIFFTAVDVLNDHIERRNAIGAVLVRADHYASFSSITLANTYVTIVAQAFDTQADGKLFCNDHGLSVNDCFAKKDPLTK